MNDLSLRCFVDYILSNGKKVSGGFNRSTGALHGFHQVRQHLGIPDLNKYNMLLLNYAGNVNLSVGVFDDDFVEVLSQGTPMSTGKKMGCNCCHYYIIQFILTRVCFMQSNWIYCTDESMPAPTVETKFSIRVQPCHVQPNCPGVVCLSFCF